MVKNEIMTRRIRRRNNELQIDKMTPVNSQSKCSSVKENEGGCNKYGKIVWRMKIRGTMHKERAKK